MAKIIMKIPGYPLLAGKDNAARAAALAVNMPGGGIDSRVCSRDKRLLERQGCKNIVHGNCCANRAGKFACLLNINDFRSGIGPCFKKDRPAV